jgi:hypothetical protein
LGWLRPEAATAAGRTTTSEPRRTLAVPSEVAALTIGAMEIVKNIDKENVIKRAITVLARRLAGLRALVNTLNIFINCAPLNSLMEKGETV